MPDRKKQESERVGARRKELIAAGYKSISFLVSPQEYEQILDAKARFKMNTRELLMHFVSGRYDTQAWLNEPDAYPVERPEHSHDDFREVQMKYDKLRGLVWDFHACKDYVLAGFRLAPGNNVSEAPYETDLFRQFDSLEQALRHCQSPYHQQRYRKLKTIQVTLFERFGPDEQVASYWYCPRLHLNDARNFVRFWEFTKDPPELKALQRDWRRTYLNS